MSEHVPTEQPFQLLENVLFLKKTSLFSAVPTNDLRSIAAIAEELSFAADKEIVRENDVGDSLFIIKSGGVVISKNMTGNRYLTLAELSVGECFGEMSVFDAEVRSASVFARSDCVLLRMSGQGLIDVILDCPFIAIELLKIFIKRLRKANTYIEQLSRSKPPRTEIRGLFPYKDRT